MKAEIYTTRRICKTCSVVFFVTPSRAQRGKGTYCSRRCMGLAQRGENHPNWKGSFQWSGSGYVGRTSNDGRKVLAHREIAERALGHPLPPGSEIHHVDGNTDNNANSNLVICGSRGYHMMLHARQRIVDHGGNPNTDKYCARCGLVKPRSSFYVSKRKWDGRRSQCSECDIDRIHERTASCRA